MVFKSEEVRKKIYGLIGEGMIEYYHAVNLPEGKIEEVEFLWSVESAAMAIENFMLKAAELGLGTVYISVANCITPPSTP